MCGCATTRPGPAIQSRETLPGELILRVADITCGHCAGAITAAIEAALPGTLVDANPVSKLVSIRGSSDRDAIETIIARAGYTASDAALA